MRMITHPPHWSHSEWGDLSDLVPPDRLCHGMWMVLDDPHQVLDWHHRGEGEPPWLSMIEGEWPSGWNDRARVAGRIARSRRIAARRGTDPSPLVPPRPPHWSVAQWDRLEQDVATDLLFDALWLLTVDPPIALADLKRRPELPGVATEGGDPNAWCWLAGTGRQRTAKTRDAILAMATGRGAAGISRFDVEHDLKLGRETAAGHLRALVQSGQLQQIPGAAGGRGGASLYVTPLNNGPDGSLSVIENRPDDLREPSG